MFVNAEQLIVLKPPSVVSALNVSSFFRFTFSLLIYIQLDVETQKKANYLMLEIRESPKTAF